MSFNCVDWPPAKVSRQADAVNDLAQVSSRKVFVTARGEVLHTKLVESLDDVRPNETRGSENGDHFVIKRCP